MVKSALYVSLAVSIFFHALAEAQGVAAAPAATPASMADRLSADCAGVSGYVAETAGSDDSETASRASRQYDYWMGRYVDANDVTSDEAERVAKTQFAAFTEMSMTASITRHGQNGRKQAEDLATSIGSMFQRCEQIYALEANNG